MTIAQIESGPQLDDVKSVSRHEEERLHSFYGWRTYWAGGDLAGGGESAPVPPGDEMTGDCQAESAREDDQPPARAELVSAIEIVEYRLEADGGLAGNVADLILDGKTWIVRYFVVGTGEEDTSKQVLLATQLMDPVSFDTFAVYADVSAEVVLAGPDFDPSLPINKESGEVLRDHFSC